MRPPRYSMFVQMFLWFWMTMALLAAAMIGVELLTNQQPLTLGSRALVERALQEESVRAQMAWNQGGKQGLNNELSAFRRETNVEAFLVDPSTEQDVRGAQLPLTLGKLTQGIGQGSDPQWSMAGLWLQTAIPTPGKLVFATRFERNAFTARPLSRMLRFGVAVLTAGLVCWLMARRFTRPIDTLREATRQLSKGNLGARANLSRAWRSYELVALAGDFNAMAGQIETLVTAQKRLVGDVSHELRSPLTRLKIALALAGRDTGSPRQLTSHLDRIGLETGFLEVLIDELLLLSRLENHLDVRPATPFDWSEIVASCVADLRWESQNRAEPVEILWHPPDFQAWVNGDATFLKRALENVGRNALNYAPPGSQVTFDLKREGGWLVTKILDEGPGIPEAELKSVFQPFYRVDIARERQVDGGTGLGLAIAERAVQASRGTILARNRSTGGLEVEISLPFTEF